MNRLKKIPKQYFIFLLIAFLIMIPGFINHGIHGDDATFHLTNIMAMNQNSSFLNLPTRIRPLIASNFGYGSGIFYPELIHIVILYLWKIFSVFHIPLSATVVIFMIIFITITASVMYNLLLKLTKQSFCSTIASILYITLPYFIADIYRRSAYGELISFLALPLIILGIYYLLYESNRTKFYIYFILGYYLLFASHLISVVYVTLFAVIFLLFHIKDVFKKKNFIAFVIASIVILGLSLTYIVPIFEHKLASNYMVFKNGYMFSRKIIIRDILSIKDLLIPGKWLTAYIPVIMIALLLLFFAKIKKIKELVPVKIILSFTTIMFVSLVLTISPTIWKILPDFLLTIQFSWRNCTYLGFAVSVLASFGLLMIPNNYRKISTVIIILTICLNTAFILSNPKYILPVNKTFGFREGGMGWQKEYLTQNGYQNVEYFLSRDDSIKIINNSDAVINHIRNKTPYLRFYIIQNSKTVVEIPRFYYLWYLVTLTDNNNHKQKLSFYENNNGFIEFEIPKSGKIEVKYQKTLISKFSEIISNISICGFIVLIGSDLFIKRKKYPKI